MWHRTEPTPQPGLAIVRVTVRKGYLVSCADDSGKTGVMRKGLKWTQSLKASGLGLKV